MTDAQSRTAQWLRASRAQETQETLAQDIERVTGWHITRDRYSKYESGSLPIGPKVLGYFVAYWSSRGKPGPDSMDTAWSDTTSVSDVSAYLARIDNLVAELQADRRLIRELLDRLAPRPDPLQVRADAALDAAEAEEPAPAQSTSQPPRSDRALRAEAGSRGRREGEPA